MEYITIPLHEYNTLLNLKKNKNKAMARYRNTEKGKKANALAQQRWREKNQLTK